ncbi:unnamed protein product [Caenorhabditis auriculariae]|uniref:Uncharacterized protein n=1 Tax=Caenorhabditis auriculariae TaxID=2777116 RepID=A0A8S1GRG7_9PELO|nr:unnamed protein product [Caenorhabditis auriculariae]
MENSNSTPANSQSQDDFPLADDDDTVTIIGGKTPRAAHPLPREEPAEDPEEKARLITQVLELQNTLDDLSQRVDSVKEESLKLRSENQVLGQYIHNLMSSSSVFQSSHPRPKQNGTESQDEDFGDYEW